MQVFPIFLDVRGRSCLVAGGGAVGLEKAQRLREAGAEVVVLDPAPSAATREFASGDPAVTIVPREFRPDDCDGRALVFACTADDTVNAQVLEAARARGILVQRTDGNAEAGEVGDFLGGAVLRRGELCVAVSSGGASPAFASATRDRIAEVVGDEFGEAVAMLGQLRSRLRAEVADPLARRRASRAVVDGGLVDLLREGRRAEAAALVATALDEARGPAASRTTGEAEAAGQEARCTR